MIHKRQWHTKPIFKGNAISKEIFWTSSNTQLNNGFTCIVFPLLCDVCHRVNTVGNRPSSWILATDTQQMPSIFINLDFSWE